jgi:hypothetical protein
MSRSIGLVINRRNDVSPAGQNNGYADPLAHIDQDVRPLIVYVDKEHEDAGKSGTGSHQEYGGTTQGRGL